jgi:predicted protein tyrosine phosphatase
MNCIVHDRRSFEQGILVRSSYILISTRDPDKRKVRVPKQTGLREMLHLAFHDAEPTGNMVLPEKITLMTQEQAWQVWAFVRKWEKEDEAVAVHCEQGMTRSPAVAAGICKGLGGNEAEYFNTYQPHLYVYGLPTPRPGHCWHVFALKPETRCFVPRPILYSP